MTSPPRDDPPGAAAVDALVGDLAAGGVDGERGAFSIDPDKAREKLAEFQFADPWHHLLELCQASLLRGARALVVRADGDELIIADDAPAWSREALRTRFNALFGGQGRAAEASRCLAIGLAGAARRGGGGDLVSGGPQGESLRLRVTGSATEQAEVEAAADVHRLEAGTRVRLRVGVEEAPAALAYLRPRLRFADAAVTIAGAAANGSLVAAATLTAAPANGAVTVGYDLETGARPPAAYLVRHGVVIGRRPLTLAAGQGRGYAALLRVDGLALDLSRAQVVGDGLAPLIAAASEAHEAAVRRAVDELAGRPDAAGLAGLRASLLGELAAATGGVRAALENARFLRLETPNGASWTAVNDLPAGPLRWAPPGVALRWAGFAEPRCLRLSPQDAAALSGVRSVSPQRIGVGQVRYGWWARCGLVGPAVAFAALAAILVAYAGVPAPSGDDVLGVSAGVVAFGFLVGFFPYVMAPSEGALWRGWRGVRSGAATLWAVGLPIAVAVAAWVGVQPQRTQVRDLERCRRVASTDGPRRRGIVCFDAIAQARRAASTQLAQAPVGRPTQARELWVRIGSGRPFRLCCNLLVREVGDDVRHPVVFRNGDRVAVVADLARAPKGGLRVVHGTVTSLRANSRRRVEHRVGGVLLFVILGLCALVFAVPSRWRFTTAGLIVAFAVGVGIIVPAAGGIGPEPIAWFGICLCLAAAAAVVGAAGHAERSAVVPLVGTLVSELLGSRRVRLALYLVLGGGAIWMFPGNTRCAAGTYAAALAVLFGVATARWLKRPLIKS